MMLFRRLEIDERLTLHEPILTVCIAGGAYCVPWSWQGKLNRATAPVVHVQSPQVEMTQGRGAQKAG